MVLIGNIEILEKNVIIIRCQFIYNYVHIYMYYLLEESCYESSATMRPSNGIQENDRRHNEKTIVFIL